MLLRRNLVFILFALTQQTVSGGQIFGSIYLIVSVRFAASPVNAIQRTCRCRVCGVRHRSDRYGEQRLQHSVRPGHSQHVLAEIGEDQAGRDRCGLVEADFRHYARCRFLGRATAGGPDVARLHALPLSPYTGAAARQMTSTLRSADD